MAMILTLVMPSTPLPPAVTTITIEGWPVRVTSFILEPATTAVSSTTNPATVAPSTAAASSAATAVSVASQPPVGLNPASPNGVPVIIAFSLLGICAVAMVGFVCYALIRRRIREHSPMYRLHQAATAVVTSTAAQQQLHRRNAVFSLSPASSLYSLDSSPTPRPAHSETDSYPLENRVSTHTAAAATATQDVRVVIRQPPPSVSSSSAAAPAAASQLPHLSVSDHAASLQSRRTSALADWLSEDPCRSQSRQEDSQVWSDVSQFGSGSLGSTAIRTDETG